MFFIISVMIVVGGLTRLTDSGLSGMLHYKEISYDENIENLKKYKKKDVIDVLKKEALIKVDDLPDSIEKIYSEPRYILYKKFMHKKSIKLIKQILS